MTRVLVVATSRKTRGGSIAESKEHIDFKLQLYVDQIQPAATSVANPGFVDAK